MRNGGAAHKNIEVPRSIYGAMPERKWIEGFPFESTKHRLLGRE